MNLRGWTYISLMCLALAASAYQQQKGKRDEYDPDKLAPSEVACGRMGSKKSPPCQCVKFREEKAMVAMEECRRLHANDTRARLACYAKAPACGDIAVSDAEHIRTDADGKEMPRVCKRTCHRARCECCHS